MASQTSSFAAGVGNAPRKLWVGIDLDGDGQPTAGSVEAAMQAGRFARGVGAVVALLHGGVDGESFDPRKERFVPSSGGSGRPAQEEALRELAARVEEAHGGSIGVRVVENRAAEGLLAAAAEDAGGRPSEVWIVVAKRSHTGLFDRVRIGTTASAVLRGASGPVWLVAPDGAGLPETVLVAATLDRLGDRVVSVGACLAKRPAGSNARLHAVHALSLPLSIQMEGEAERAAFERDRRREAREHLAERLGDEGFDAHGCIHVGFASPTQAVLEVAKHIGAQLVVVGTVAREGLAAHVIGSTAERLFARLDASLVVVRPEAKGRSEEASDEAR